ncbi:MAG: glutathione S-transferase N-terminal domain-containing protein [Rhodospirillaceae bacterium]|nr:glutathione S-transferase N-terminal domain-containing protein [Rhodospirillaceae bacterium]
MIDLYTAATPNGQKVHIMLEETGLSYNEHYVSIDKGEQFAPEFLAISPNNKIPAIVDHDGPGGETVSIFESGCILQYLAEKAGRFLPESPLKRIETMEWLFWQMGGFGPMLGQAHHFRAYAPERIQYAYDRYSNEAQRLYQVLDRRLAGRDYVAAGEYTIADMAIFPWCRLHGRQGQDLADHPNVKRWFDAIAQRPAVIRDMAKLEDKADQKNWSAEDWSNLFGSEQYRKR